uniref:Acyl-CoA binding domain containing 4 n=1 Tax=Paramormyrops kingsleyae TaxID=1676925 RepID=A0A3B3RFR6_9TELE
IQNCVNNTKLSGFYDIKVVKCVYRPSYDVMLRFYGLYKQAVCGPCRRSRPGFWDPVGRYKWDAWSRLGEMSSEAAMTAYALLSLRAGKYGQFDRDQTT